MSITPGKSYNIQIFKGNNWELTFEKGNRIEGLDSANLIGADMRLVDLRIQKLQDNNRTQYNIKLNKDGNVFVAKNLSEDLYNMFLSKINGGEIVETIEDLVILFSDLH